jgi:mercuric ion binding protein
MKTLNIYAALLFSIFAINFSFAQKSTLLDHKENIKVWGNCETCKKKIEKAAISAGAVTANWNDESHILALSYDGAKTSSDKIQRSIAAAGYDTQDFTANDNAYNKLPNCCKYERKSSAVSTAMNCCSMESCGSAKDNCKDMACCSGKECKKS